MIRSSNKISDKIKRNCLDDVSYDSKWDNFRAKPFFFFFLFFHMYASYRIMLYTVLEHTYSQPRACVRMCVRAQRGRLKNYRLSGGLQMAHKTKWIAGLSVVIRSVTSKYRCRPG